MNFGIATKSAAISCNVSYGKSITPEALAALLSGQLPVDGWIFHLDTFFNELPYSYILDVLDENKLTVQQVADVFFQLPEPLQGKNFKQVLADHVK